MTESGLSFLPIKVALCQLLPSHLTFTAGSPVTLCIPNTGFAMWNLPVPLQTLFNHPSVHPREVLGSHPPHIFFCLSSGLHCYPFYLGIYMQLTKLFLICGMALSLSQVKIPPDPKQIATKGFSVVFIPTGYTDQQKKKVYQNLTSGNGLKQSFSRWPPPGFEITKRAITSSIIVIKT